MESTLAERLWHMIRAAYYMVRKGFSKHKLIMDLHLLLKRGKLAGKAIGNLLASHHHHGPHIGGDIHSAFSCRSMDPGRSFYSPGAEDVEFSCNSTPSYPSFFASFGKRKNRRGRHDDMAAQLARELEMLSSEAASPAVASPSMWNSSAGAAAGRQLRITDSPYPVTEEAGESDGRVDRKAEEFIKRFYEQLRLQRSVPPTPENQCRQRKLG